MKQYLILILMIFGVTNSLVAKGYPINKENETLADDIYKSKWLEDEGLCEVHAIGDARDFYYIGEWNGDANSFGTGVFFKPNLKKVNLMKYTEGNGKMVRHMALEANSIRENGETIFYFGNLKMGKWTVKGTE